MSHSLCECHLMLVEPGFDELDRGEPAVCAVTMILWGLRLIRERLLVHRRRRRGI